MEEKLKIIDALRERHPSYGVSKGWSKYAGGMADTGRWFTRKMLDVPIEELQAFLDDIITAEQIPPTPLTEQEEKDSKIFHQLPNKGCISELERKRWRDFKEKEERKLLYGDTFLQKNK